jgi:hypothetical protein
LLNFVVKTLLYVFILNQTDGTLFSVLLTAAAVLALELYSYNAGVETGMNLELVKVKDGTDQEPRS